MTIFYFSGVGGRDDWAALMEAGVRHVLVDPYDLVYVPADWDGELLLDCGAFKMFQQGQKDAADVAVGKRPAARARRIAPLIPEELVALAQARRARGFFHLDVIGDLDATRRNWEAMRDTGAFPVWPYTTGPVGRAWLAELAAEGHARIGVGALVVRMRAASRAKPRTPGREEADRLLADLTRLCQTYPNRLHIFGCSWYRAIEELAAAGAASMDSAKWASAGGRRKSLIFKHARDGHLHEAPAATMAEKLGYAAAIAGNGKDARRVRLVICARALDEYCNAAQRPAELQRAA